MDRLIDGLWVFRLDLSAETSASQERERSLQGFSSSRHCAPALSGLGPSKVLSRHGDEAHLRVGAVFATIKLGLECDDILTRSDLGQSHPEKGSLDHDFPPSLTHARMNRGACRRVALSPLALKSGCSVQPDAGQPDGESHLGNAA